MTTILQKRTDSGISLKPKNYDWFLHIFDMDFGYNVTMPINCPGLFIRYDQLVVRGEINPDNFEIVEMPKCEDESLSPKKEGE